MKRTRNKRSQSGAAMVELAVLMVAFVPMILIPLYLQDALQYKLTAQERVFSTVWDFAFGKYDRKSVNDLQGAILSENEEIFKNCKSGNKRNKSNPATPWADFRWPSSAVECKQKDKNFMKPSMVPLAAGFHNAYTKGGLVECEGAIEVANHYVPEKIGMLTFKKNKQFFQEQGKFIEHNDGGQPLKFGVMVDPWTIHNPEGDNDIKDRGNNNPFRDRVDFCWGKGLSAATLVAFEGAWWVFLAKAMQKKLLSPAMVGFDYPPRPADITSIHPISKEYDRNAAFGRKKFWVSPYEDGSENMFKETHQVRKQTYLGCPNALDNGNC